MTSAADPTPLVLSVQATPDGLAFALTDCAMAAQIAFVAASNAQLDELAQDGPATAVSWPERGARLLALLPPSIQSLLLKVRGRELTLQIPTVLAPIPWESAFDGETSLGEQFRVARRLISAGAEAAVAARPAAGRRVRRLLVLTGPEVGDAPVAVLVARLRIASGAAVDVVRNADLDGGDRLSCVESSDIVYCIGDAATRGPLALADALAALAPGVLVVQTGSLELALRAAVRGLNVLAFASPPEDVEFGADLVTRLLDGRTLAEALRAARVALRARHGSARSAALRAALYGDGGVAPFAAGDRDAGDGMLRQVTIMSFDLVESTRLLAEIGAEHYSDLLPEYHRVCARIARAHGGVPDDPQGDDGTMCYFGHPVAREDAAVQALRAGFEIIAATGALGVGVRIGICTGEVVVREGQLVGAAIHYAARLQSIAGRGSMVVGDSTRRLVKDRFTFEPMEASGTLKGFSRPEPFFRAIAETSTFDPGDTPSAGPLLTPFVGRVRELQLLAQHLEAAQAGRLQLVRVFGEAGIGKSRLVREWKRSLIARGHTVFESRCAPDTAHSAFHPLIESLRTELKIRSDEDQATGLARLVALVSRSGLDGAAVALLAELLGIPMPERHAVLDQSADRRRRLTLDALATLAQERLQGAAACMIVEDVHWIDPSTADFLNHLAVVASDHPLLMLVTARSDADPHWQACVPVHDIELLGLAPDVARVMVQSAAGPARLPPELVRSISRRADGVPLFIEESTRMVVELARDDGNLDALAVPSTILDLLTVRLDRLGGAKQIAQAGGTIGREFPLDLLRAVLEHPASPISGADLDLRLAALLRSGLLIARSDADGMRYAFKHALMRDAAYRSLLARDRMRLHRVIAAVIGDRFDSLAARQPELLAYHFTEAGHDAEALRYWEAAARQAVSRSAHAEAIGHVSQALTVLSRTPSGDERSRAELRLQLLLAARLIATEGYGAQRVERAYARALELATALGDTAALLRILLGLEGWHFMRADFDRARSYALDVAARTAGSPLHEVQTQWALANILMHQGHMAPAVQQMDDCRAAYARLAHRPTAMMQDPGVMCLCYSAWSLWQLGFPDEALRRVHEVVELARRSGHDFSLGVALGFRAAVQHFRGENVAALDSADQAIGVCDEGAFSVWLAHARVMRGRIVAELDDPAAGVEEMAQAYDQWAASGAVVTTPFYLAMRAEGLALAGRPAEGLTLLAQARAIVERCGERYYEPEILRLHGVLVLQDAARGGRDGAAEAQAEPWLLDALACAQVAGMRSLALRAATDLAELWCKQERFDQAVRVLAPALSALEEGHDTRDWVRAKQAQDAARRGAAS